MILRHTRHNPFLSSYFIRDSSNWDSVAEDVMLVHSVLADNITLNSGTGGSVLATDEVGTDHYQRVKLTDGTADSSTVIASGNGTSTNALRVTVSSDSTGVISVDDNGGALTVDGTVTANLSATDNAVLDQIEVNTSYGDNTGGGVELGALRVTLANDSTGLISVDDNGGSLTVDGTVTANAGTNLNTSALALESGGNLATLAGAVTGTEMQVDVVTSDGIAAEAAALGNGVLIQGDDGTDRKNINVDATTGDVQVDVTNTVTVDGSGVTQPVSGTVTANLGATDNAVLDQIEVNTSYGDNTGGGTETGALRVTIANNSTGLLSIDDNGGSITVDGSVTADLGANNDVTVTGGNAHDGTTLGNPVLSGARATNSIEGVTQVANADLTHVQADLNGVLLSRPHTTLEEVISERVADTAGTSAAFTNFAAGGAGIHNYVTTIAIYNSSATDGYVDFRDGTAGSVIFTAPAPAAGGSVINLPVPLKGAANTALAYDVSGALSTVYISVVGFQAQG